MTTKQQETVRPAETGEDVADVRDAFEVVQVQERGTLYQPGVLADRLYLLRSGRMKLVRRRNGSEATHAFIAPGEVFGADSVGLDGRLDERAVATTECELWSFGVTQLPRIFEARPQLAVEVVRGLSLRQRELARRLEALASQEVPARLAAQLLALAGSIGEASRQTGAREVRGVTQQDLADLVGASRSFVSTVVNELKRSGVLSSSGRTLVIRAPDRLAALAQSRSA